MPAALQPEIATTHTIAYTSLEFAEARADATGLTCTANKKKFKLKAGNDRIYLFATVIMMDDAQ